MTAKWVQHEPGWWTLRNVGGISHESSGWYFWPHDRDKPGIGPFRTLTAAQKYVATLEPSA